MALKATSKKKRRNCYGKNERKERNLLSSLKKCYLLFQEDHTDITAGF